MMLWAIAAVCLAWLLLFMATGAGDVYEFLRCSRSETGSYLIALKKTHTPQRFLRYVMRRNPVITEVMFISESGGRWLTFPGLRECGEVTNTALISYLCQWRERRNRYECEHQSPHHVGG